MRRTPIVVVALALGACGSTPRRSARPAETGRTTATEVVSVDALADAVRRIDSRDPSHATLVTVLRRLADAIATLPGPEAQVIRIAADDLARAPAKSTEHADHVIGALRAAERALERGAASGSREVLGHLAAIEVAVAKLRPEVPLLQQQHDVVVALEAITNALSVGQGMRPPFRVAIPEQGRPTRSAADALAAAHEHALALARANWTEAPAIAGKLVDALADVVAASKRQSKELAELRFQARRLQRAQRAAFDEARWIAQALDAAIESLDDETTFTREARAAIANIDARGELAFQRARIQDAVRATLAAFVDASRARSPTRTSRLR